MRNQVVTESQSSERPQCQVKERGKCEGENRSLSAPCSTSLILHESALSNGTPRFHYHLGNERLNSVRSNASQAFNVSRQAPLHCESSWRAVCVSSLATNDEPARKETCCASVIIQVVSAIHVWQNRLRPGIAQQRGRIQPCSVLVRKMTET